MDFPCFLMLIQLAKSNNSDALSELMDRFGPLVRGVIGRNLLDTALVSVSDCEQIVWSKVWQQLSTFLGHEDPKQCQNLFAGWVSRVARNATLDEVRKVRGERRGGGCMQDAYVEGQVQAGGPGVSSIVRGISQVNRLRRQLDLLDPLSAEVIRLRFYESYTIAAIADHTQLSVDRIRLILSKAIRKIRDQLPE